MKMKEPTLNSSYSYVIKTIDSHTMGEPTRIIYDGFPELKGKTIMEKKKNLDDHYDFLRAALMLEPRGHRDMYGAVLTEPVHPEADTGVIYINSGGTQYMCGHGSIGTASMLVETGMVEVKEPYTDVVLDSPSGLIRARVKVINHKAVEASILNVPSFVYKEGLTMHTEIAGDITYDIAFGGSFFGLVDADKIGLDLTSENIDEIMNLGMEIRKNINTSVPIQHPYLDIHTVDLIEFYTKKVDGDADMKNCVVFGDKQADRSPCGTGTSAKLASLYLHGKLGLNEPFIYESITGSKFRGEIVGEKDINGIRSVIPKITGSAYITGLNTWVIDDSDYLRYGFLLGKSHIA
ncbi:MAG: proline racemase family protein [Bilifractor sp.]|jgi:proline racemase